MPGWFEKFSDFARGAQPAVDRYTTLRRLHDDKAIRLSQQEFENSMLQQRQSSDMMTAQKQQSLLDSALLGKKQDMFANRHMPGENLSDTEAQLGGELGMAINQGFNANPMEQIRSRATLPGQVDLTQLQAPGEEFVGPTQPQRPMAVPGPAFQMPERAGETNEYLGTPDQRMEMYKLQSGDRDRRTLMQALQGFDPNDKRSLASLSALSSNFDVAPFLNNNDRTPNTNFGMVVKAKEATLGRQLNAEELIALDKAMDPVRAQFQSPYPSLVKDSTGMYGPVGEDKWIPQAIINSNPGAFGRANTAGQINQDDMRASIIPGLNQMRDLADIIRQRYASDSAAMLAGRWDYLKSKANQDLDVAEYLSLADGPMLSIAAKSIGKETGNLAPSDYDRARLAYYMPWEAPGMAERKFKNLERFVPGFSSTPGSSKVHVVIDPNGKRWQYATQEEADNMRRLIAERQRNMGSK